MKRLELSLAAVAFGAVLTLFSPQVVWAHQCGPREFTVEKGSSVMYSITGPPHLIEFEVVENGDPLVARIEPPPNINPGDLVHNPTAKIEPLPTDNGDLVFKITGTGMGTTVFRIYWRGPHRDATCQVQINVHG